MKVVSVQGMKNIDANAITNGQLTSLALMENAGRECTSETLDFLKSIDQRHQQSFTILCGSGNNGGDGFVIALLLQQRTSIPITIYCIKTIDQCSPNAKTMAAQISADISILSFDELELPLGTIIIDCLFGTGLNRALNSEYTNIIQQINNSLCPTISIDIPSGLNGDSGEIMGAAVIADLTLTIGLAKTGFFLNAGPTHCGLLRCIDIGFPDSIISAEKTTTQAFFQRDAQDLLTRLNPLGHKYQNGQVLVIGGSSLYPGAPVLSSSATLRSGAGMVLLASPKKSLNPTYHALIELSLDPQSEQFTSDDLKLIENHYPKTNVIVIGPGMCNEAMEAELLESCLRSDKKLVIDAGALPHLSKFKHLFPRQAKTVLTPHSGELKRLGSDFKFKADSETQLASQLAQELSVHIISKGKFTKIFSPDGSYSINTSGSPGLATAGSGDVLAGILAAFAANHHLAFYEAILLATFIHGFAAEISPKGQRGLIADDLLELIPQAIKNISPYA